MKYNYESFTSGEYDFSEQNGLQTGDIFPNFELTSQNAEIVPLFDGTEKITVIETGSITCPLYSGNIIGMNELAKKHPEIDFKLLYIREAHPGKNIPSHKNISEKITLANKIKDHFPENREILVDNIDGAVHEKVGLLPNTIVIVKKDGEVLYKIDWNNIDTLSKALECIENDEPADSITPKFRPAPPTISIPVLHRAGNDALFDFLLHLPKVIFERAKKFFNSENKQF